MIAFYLSFLCLFVFFFANLKFFSSYFFIPFASLFYLFVWLIYIFFFQLNDFPLLFSHSLYWYVFSSLVSILFPTIFFACICWLFSFCELYFLHFLQPDSVFVGCFHFINCTVMRPSLSVSNFLLLCNCTSCLSLVHFYDIEKNWNVYLIIIMCV